MLLLHGSWLDADVASDGRFAVWGEIDSERWRAVSKRRQTPPSHPFAATPAEIEAALAPPSTTAVEPARIVVHLPSNAGAPLPSAESARVPNALDRSEITLDPWQIDAICFPAGEAVRWLLLLGGRAIPAGFEPSGDLCYWTAAARLALELLHGQRVVPFTEMTGNAVTSSWRPDLSGDADRVRLAALAGAMPPVCRAMSWGAKVAPAAAAAALLEGFITSAVGELARAALADCAADTQRMPSSGGRGKKRQPAMAEAWLMSLAGNPAITGAHPDLATFQQQYQTWLAPTQAPTPSDSFRICFRLEPPLMGGGPAASDLSWNLEYLLQATDDPSLLVPAHEVWRQRGSTARFLDRRLDNPQERLLAGLGRASRLFPPIERGLRSATPEATALSAAEAQTLIRESAPLLQSSGFGVLVPALQRKLGLRLRLGSRSRSSSGGVTSVLNWDRLVDYDWQISLGDETLSRAEFEALAALKEPIVQVRGHWVELQADFVERTLALLQGQDQGEAMPLEDALRLALTPDADPNLPIIEVETAGWIDALLRSLREGGTRRGLDEPPGFGGRLRPYQKAGVAWLDTLARYGVGACLADDMGLGKTVQLIALLLHRRAECNGASAAPTLLVCPTSVVGNWRHELSRFAPGLRVLAYHGADRHRRELAAEAPAHDVVISTYALLHRDEAELAGVDWSIVALDEAQNIKNASTQAAQVARRLRAGWRVALTGTPIENRLSDLWSLFQFLDPGYLGSNEDFRRRFAGPIERAGDVAATARLKALVSPLILRRLKTDRSIIDDLPEKNEMKVFCTLTREQATLYQAVLSDAMQQIDAAEGIERRGLILAMIAKLKQTCDHPALLLKDGSALAGRSGKLARLTEMLQEVIEADERALIFTQYAQMGTLLRAYLQDTLGRDALFLHGGTPARQRDQMVERFQQQRRGPPLFILSIKAGGTGLNLTRANHVFHFDRWWNPAVENQATDRAFRIGQRRDVQVHKYICAGTFEEAIDELIERKIALSQSIVGTSEAWITEMSTDELRDLFALREAAVA